MKSKWTMFWIFFSSCTLVKSFNFPLQQISSLRTCSLTRVQKVSSELPFQLLNVLRDNCISVYTLTYCFWFNFVFNITSDPYYLKRSSECFDKITWAKKVDEGVQAAVDSCQYIACIICCLQLQHKSTFTGMILFTTTPIDRTTLRGRKQRPNMNTHIPIILIDLFLTDWPRAEFMLMRDTELARRL